MTKFKKFNKKDIAIGFFDRAMKLYDEGDFFSALHLAGASEEIWGVCLREKGIENSLETDIKGVVLISKNFYYRELSERDARNLINQSKNSIKHLYNEDDMFVELDPQEEAKAIIIRALTNLWRLGETPAHYERFWEKLENRS